MTDDQDKPRTSLAVWLVVSLLSLPIVYVLSIGPMALLFKRGYAGEWVRVFYSPLRYAYLFPPAGELLDWYIDNWGGN